MAVVWLARDLRHGRRVAVKLLKPDLLAGTGHGRFLREIGFLAELSHPNILPLFDSGEARDLSTGVSVPFFTMPYAPDDTLRERLLAQDRLTLDETVGIVRDVAAGLDYAHAAGIVHRDIKPGNILLAGDRAVVADFGIARAVDAAVGMNVTEDGARIGTPHYLAPESPADARSDQYSLACVVHEMLTGNPPFEGNAPAAVLARHLVDPPPSMTKSWPACPPGVDAAVRRALAKDPGERFRSAGEFARVLESAARGEPISAETMRLVAPPRRKLDWRAVAGVAVALLAALAIWLVMPGAGAGGGGALDSTRYVILQGGAGGSGVEDEMLRDALLRWNGISVVDPFQAREVIARRRGDGAMRPAVASAIATRLGAGRYVLREVTRSGDSSHVRLAVYETATNRLLGEHSAVLPGGTAMSPEALRLLADSALLGRLGSPPGGTALGGSASLPAVEAFARGGEAIGQWDLPAAEAAFADALRYDAAYPQATVWLALVRSWLDAPVATWQPLAVRSGAGAERLSVRDREIASALLARSQGDMASACGRWRELGARFPNDFVPQYGLADCLVNDNVVVRDAGSRSGWSFRTNFAEASDAYNRAFALFPRIYRSLEPDAPVSIRSVYQARYKIQRGGRAAAPDTGLFLAQATLDGDSIAFVPLPAAAVMSGDPSTVPLPASVEGASRLLRARHYDAVAAWLQASPEKAAPLAAMAEALELLGDRSAVDTLRRARAITRDPIEVYRIAVAEAFLRLRMSIPDDVRGMQAARAMADSLLFVSAPSGQPFERAALAALTGRGALAVELWGRPELTGRLDVAPYLAGDAPALVATAAMGGPVDSIAVLERRVTASIDREFADPDRLGEQMRWLAPAATYAWPHFVARSLQALRHHGDPVLDAAAAAAVGDSAGVLAALNNYTAYRAKSGQNTVTLDALPAEAQLRWAAGDRVGALGLLDGTLGTLFGRGPNVLHDPLEAAGLVRAAALRARYADDMGEHELASKWNTVVRILWSEMDPALAPVVGGAAEVSKTTR
jgi:hypothetical protein